LPGEWSDAIDVGNVDCENGLLVSSKAGASRNQFGRDDVRVLVVYRLECREIEVGIRVASGDVKPGRVVVAVGRGCAVVGRLPLEDATIIKEVDRERHLCKSPTYLSLHRSLA